MTTVRRSEGAAVRRSEGAAVRRCDGAAVLGMFLLITLLSACGQPKETTPLQPVALPDISRAAESVQKQIRDRYQALQGALERKDQPGELATAINRVVADRAKAAAMGHAGHEAASAITWDGVIEKLTTLPES